MIYLDYSATTKPEKEVLDTFTTVSSEYFGNPNSLHKLGIESKKLINASSKQIANILNIKEDEIIYTSGATEANNMAVFGIVNYYKNRGKTILTTRLEHSSIKEPLNYLKSHGYNVVYLELTKDGQVNLAKLKDLLNDDVILVTIASINSETGIKQDIEKIGQILREYPKIIFHTDITQSIGKEKIDLQYVDLASFSAQKFFGLKGIGALIKKKNIEIVPLIQGGKSTTIYRSGTPSVALIASTAKALRLAYNNIDEKIEKVQKLNSYLITELKKIEEVHINSNASSIFHIINISIPKIKPETMLHALEQQEIYISTKTACSTDDYSEAVYELTNNKELASTSLRISISHLTTKEELELFIAKLKEQINKLKELSR